MPRIGSCTKCQAYAERNDHQGERQYSQQRVYAHPPATRQERPGVPRQEHGEGHTEHDAEDAACDVRDEDGGDGHFGTPRTYGPRMDGVLDVEIELVWLGQESTGV